jgi:hypothetical protein
MELVGSIFTAVINGGWKIYLAAFIASAALLFIPDSLVTQLGLEEIRRTYRRLQNAPRANPAGKRLFASIHLRACEYRNGPHQ